MKNAIVADNIMIKTTVEGTAGTIEGIKTTFSNREANIRAKIDTESPSTTSINHTDP